MIKETFKQAVQNVLSNKVRTFLTMLASSSASWPSSSSSVSATA